MSILRLAITSHGYMMHGVGSGEEALSWLNEHRPDVILLDMQLPDMDGFEVCHRIRAMEYTTLPVLMLTARDSVRDKIAGLDSGADDYITKPFDFEELVARIRAGLRRTIARTQRTHKTVVGDLLLDSDSRQVWRGGRQLAVTKREFDLLELLAQNAVVLALQDAL